MKGDEYKCAWCGGVFEKATDEQEVIEELKQNFGENMEPYDCDIVCDDCYNKIIPKILN